MANLTNRNRDMLLMGAGHSGTFAEGFEYVIDTYQWGLNQTQIKELENFCEYIDTEIGGAGPINIQQLWKAFKNPEDEAAQAFAQGVKEKIAEIKAY